MIEMRTQGSMERDRPGGIRSMPNVGPSL